MLLSLDIHKACNSVIWPSLNLALEGNLLMASWPSTTTLGPVLNYLATILIFLLWDAEQDRDDSSPLLFALAIELLARSITL